MAENLRIVNLNAPISNGALDGKNLPKMMKVLNWGKSITTQGDVYLNDETLKHFEEIQKKSGRDEDVAVDFDHNSVPGSKEYVAGAPKKIAGYGDPIIIKGDGLYLKNLEWTPLGEENARNYKDLSPAISVDENGIVMGLHSVALTPNGSVYKLNFYSADFDNIILKKMNSEYNKDGGNPGVDYKSKNCYGNGKDTYKPLDAENQPSGSMSGEDAKKLSTEGDNDVSLDENKENKTYSAVPPAWKGALNPITSKPYMEKYNQTLKSMAADVNLPLENDSDKERVLRVWMAKYQGPAGEQPELIVSKSNTADGGLKQFASEFETLKNEIKSLKEEKQTEAKRHAEFERNALIAQATKEGKVIPFSAEFVNKVDLEVLKDAIANTPKNIVPLNSKMRILSADGKAEKVLTHEEKKQIFREQAANNKQK